ncbi:MAG TPA: hypothetical protein VN428_04350 [Bryobacteraceae bacterium]|nr:hypothetical protein [Bryobacteraceae bacterium]
MPVSLFRRKAPAPGLETGLTLAQWDALYGEDAQRRRLAKFKHAAWISAVLLGVTVVVVSVAHDLPRTARYLIADLGMLSLVVFAISAVVVGGDWLLRRFGPRREVQQNTLSRRGRHRRKRRAQN